MNYSLEISDRNSPAKYDIEFLCPPIVVSKLHLGIETYQEAAKMKYTFIVQDDGLHVVADCFGATIVLAEGPTTIGLVSSKGIVTEVHKGRLIGKEFLHDDPYYGVSH